MYSKKKMNINVLVLNHFNPALVPPAAEVRESVQRRWQEITKRVLPPASTDSVTDLVDEGGVWALPRVLPQKNELSQRSFSLTSTTLTYDSKGRMNRPFQEKGLLVNVEA
jgi:hypothetical protein